ncbi:MAG: hypothetical protein HXS50_03730 [Theionarchaea archaeon]|nr:hypothetical protein [Theionarchaea archaeon]
MEVISDEVAFHDGNHNMVPRFVRWRERDWLVFRSGSGHRSPDGRIVVVSSLDLTEWTGSKTVIDTPLDDRDPSIFVCGDRLFATSLSVDRRFLDDSRPFDGIRSQGSCRCFVSYTEDGREWSTPVQALPDNYVIWWPIVVGDTVYAGVQRRIPDSFDFETFRSTSGLSGLARPLEFANKVDRQAELWKSEDGINWEQVGIICDRDQASETALALLPDSRMVGFVRHDDHTASREDRNMPEVAVSDPPYERWDSSYRFNFPNNGPCIGSIGGRIVTCSRAFFDDPRTPMTDDLCRDRIRGLILGFFDVENAGWSPTLVIPHHTGSRFDVTSMDESLNFPDISYAWMRDEGKGIFSMSYYEGYKGRPSDIRFAKIRIGGHPTSSACRVGGDL